MDAAPIGGRALEQHFWRAGLREIELDDVHIDMVAAAQLVAAHGKVVQCLAEAYPLGVRRSTNAEAVVRAAKLKALA